MQNRSMGKSLEDGLLVPIKSSGVKHLSNFVIAKVSEELRKPGEPTFRLVPLNRTEREWLEGKDQDQVIANHQEKGKKLQQEAKNKTCEKSVKTTNDAEYVGGPPKLQKHQNTTHTQNRKRKSRDNKSWTESSDHYSRPRNNNKEEIEPWLNKNQVFGQQWDHPQNFTGLQVESLYNSNVDNNSIHSYNAPFFNYPLPVNMHGKGLLGDCPGISPFQSVPASYAYPVSGNAFGNNCGGIRGDFLTAGTAYKNNYPLFNTTPEWNDGIPSETFSPHIPARSINDGSMNISDTIHPRKHWVRKNSWKRRTPWRSKQSYSGRGNGRNRKPDAPSSRS